MSKGALRDACDACDAQPGKPLPALVPALAFPPEVLRRAQGIRWAIFDVDGVLTDGRIYLGEAGEVFKAFSTLDGHGLKLLAAAGIRPVVITGRDSPAVRRRVADLGIADAVYGAADKLAAATPLMAALGLGWDSCCAMGDDWPDLPLLRRAALACAPPNAHVEVRSIAHHITSAAGGHGAARECCDLLLMAAGRYPALLAGELPVTSRPTTRQKPKPPPTETPARSATSRGPTTNQKPKLPALAPTPTPRPSTPSGSASPAAPADTTVPPGLTP